MNCATLDDLYALIRIQWLIEMTGHITTSEDNNMLNSKRVVH